MIFRRKSSPLVPCGACLPSEFETCHDDKLVLSSGIDFTDSAVPG